MVDKQESIEASAAVAASLVNDDPRVVLAAERTLMAWIRTGLAMMGFGFVVAKFGLFLREIVVLQGGERVEPPQWSLWIGAAMVALGIVVNLVAGVEHWRYLRGQRHVPGGFGTGYRTGILSALLLAAVGAVMFVHLFLLWEA